MDDITVAAFMNEIDAAYVTMYAAQERYAQTLHQDSAQADIDRSRNELRNAKKAYRSAVDELNHYLTQTVIRVMEDAIYNAK